MCQGCIPVSYLLHLCGVLVRSRAETVPVQPECFTYASSPPSRDFPTVSQEGREFPHGIVTPLFPW